MICQRSDLAKTTWRCDAMNGCDKLQSRARDVVHAPYDTITMAVLCEERSGGRKSGCAAQTDAKSLRFLVYDTGNGQISIIVGQSDVEIHTNNPKEGHAHENIKRVLCKSMGPVVCKTRSNQNSQSLIRHYLPSCFLRVSCYFLCLLSRFPCINYYSSLTRW